MGEEPADGDGDRVAGRGGEGREGDGRLRGTGSLQEQAWGPQHQEILRDQD